MMVHVAVDARTVYSARRRGTGKNLIDLYRTIARQQGTWRFTMFHRQARATDDPFAGTPNVAAQFIDIRGDRCDLWRNVRLPLAARWAGASVLHAPANVSPSRSSVPVVVTIHDLIPLDRPSPGTDAGAWVRSVRRSGAMAARVMTPSAYTASRLVQELGVPADKVTVNPWAPDSACRHVTDPAVLDDVRVRFGLRPGQRYVFGFGAPDPRKNTARIVAAWAGLPPSVRADFGLLLVGLDRPEFLQQARDEAARLAPEGGWSLMPFAAEADIPALLSGASALCYPSLSEGFGLPVLDAFECGTPVITSATTSLPEVTGDAGLLVDPTDVEAIRAAMHRLASEPALAEELRARGRERLKQYSWDRCAATAAGVLAAAAQVSL